MRNEGGHDCNVVFKEDIDTQPKMSDDEAGIPFALAEGSFN